MYTTMARHAHSISYHFFFVFIQKLYSKMNGEMDSTSKEQGNTEFTFM